MRVDYVSFIIRDGLTDLRCLLHYEENGIESHVGRVRRPIEN
jgi:hypothetical protein